MHYINHCSGGLNGRNETGNNRIDNQGVSVQTGRAYEQYRRLENHHDYEELAAARQAVRDEINELQAQLEGAD